MNKHDKLEFFLNVENENRNCQNIPLFNKLFFYNTVFLFSFFNY